MVTSINEPIRVGAVFERGQIKPAWFVWQGRRYEHCHVTMRWQTQLGTASILHLSLTDGLNDFELTFNQHTLAWRLAAITGPGG